MNLITKLIPIVFALGLSSCAVISSGDSQPRMLINEVIILNQLRVPIYDVKIEIEKYHQFFSCNEVLARAICSTQFPSRPYEGAWLILSWKPKGRRHQQRRFQISTDHIRNPAGLLKAVVRIDDAGYAAFLSN
jgi:hypothetical protein